MRDLLSALELDGYFYSRSQPVYAVFFADDWLFRSCTSVDDGAEDDGARLCAL